MRHALLLAVAMLTSCAQKDTTAPPAPRVNPVASPTSRSKVVLTGSAEFGATITIAGGLAAVTTTADPYTAQFRAEVGLNTTIPVGAISVKNTLSVTATDAAGNVSDPTTFDVLFGPEPGVPAKLTFAFTGAAASGTIAAGTEVTYTYQLTDAYDGPVDHPLQVIASAPNTSVFDDGISGNGVILGFTRTGSFNVTARATGVAGVSKVLPVTVTPAGGPRFVSLGLTLSRMATGDTTAALTVVKDLYDNVIINDANGMAAGLSLTCAPQDPLAPASACSRMGNAFTVSRAGVYKITASYNDGTNPAAGASAYVFAEDAPDVAPPVAAITTIIYPTGASQIPRNTNSRIEAQLDFTDNKALASATLYALFGGNPACIANSGTLLLTGQTHVASNASVRVPACAFPWDTISLFATVVDEAGNQGFSSMNTSLSVSGAGMGTVAGGTGYALGVVAVGGQSLGQSGLDVAWDPGTEIAYVPTTNNQRIVALLPDRTQSTLRDITGQSYQFNNGPTGVAVNATGDLYVGRTNNGNIAFIPTTLPVTPPSLVSGLNGPGRLVFDRRPTTPVLCATRTGTASQGSCYSVAAQTLTPVVNNVSPTPAPVGQELVGMAVGASSGGTFTLWLLYSGCGLYKTTTAFDGTAPAAPTAVAVTPSLGSNCTDLAALTSGDVAVLNANSVQRVTPAGASSPVVTNLNSPAGLDFASGTLFILDNGNGNGNQAVLKVTAAASNPF